MYRMYRYCKLFSCSPEEYERRPFHETTWLLEIDKTYEAAVADAQERANKEASR